MAMHGIGDFGLLRSQELCDRVVGRTREFKVAWIHAAADSAMWPKPALY
jgi:hypothetical protein